MTSQPIEANVVLTADNSQYDQAMVASAGSTASLGKAVDTLGQKISNLTKSAGKGLIGIAAADVAVITAATAAWAAYEKQVSRLEAQAAIRGRGQAQETRLMKDYTAAVKGMRTEFGTTTTEASKLVETLSKVTDIRASRNMKDLSTVFVEMSRATGESSEGLAASMTNLQKVMGQPINERTVRKNADMFTYLSAQTNASAQGLVELTASLAPVGEAMGMNTKQVAGFATAFAQAGQQGQSASMVFNKVATDITRSLATGSQEVAYYANLVGESEKEFRKLEGAEQVIRILEALGAQGRGAASEFERLGLDGTKSIRSLQAVIAQSGGVRQAYSMAVTGAESGAAAEGAAAATKGVSDEFEKLREQVVMTAETFARTWAPVAEGFVGGMVEAMQVINNIVEGPLGKFMSLIAGVVAPLAAGGGALLLFAGTLLKVAAAFALVRNSASLGIREGFRGGAGMVVNPDGSVTARGEGTLGPRGAQIAEGGSWMQRGLYNIGQPIGAGLAGMSAAARERYVAGRQFVDPNYVAGPPRGPVSYAAGGLGRALEWFVTPQLDQMRYQDPSRRTGFFERHTPWTQARLQREIAGATGAAAMYEQQLAGPMAGDTVAREEAKQRAAAAREHARAMQTELDARRRNTFELGQNSTGFARLTRGMASFAVGAGGAVAGGLWAGGKALAQSPLGAPIGSMAAMAGVSAFGIESNAAMLGAMGLTLGAPGAAVGFGAGAMMDMAAANDKVDESIKTLKTDAEAASKSGMGLAALDEAAIQTQKDLTDLQDSFSVGSKDYWLNLGTGLGSVKNSIEWIFGESDIQELQKNHDAAQQSIQGTEAVVRDLAEGMGVVFSGSRQNQLRQMEEFMATTGTARMGAAGVTMEQLQATRGARMFMPGMYEMLLGVATQPNADMMSRLRSGGGFGAMLAGSASAQRAMTTGEADIELFYRVTNELYETARSAGKDNLDILKETQETKRRIGVEDNKAYELAGAVQQKAMQALQMGAPSLGRVGGFQQTIAMGQAIMAVPPKTPGMAANIEEARQMTAQAFVDMDQYFRQLLLAQDQYELQRERAQEDYNLQRTYQEYDYQLSRSRAEESFNRNRARAVSDFHRSQRRAWFDFHLQRERAEEDFNHQVQVQAKQMAQGVYDIYQRVQTERTSSATWLLSNAQDQLTRMEEQSENLRRLRRMGVSDSVIQQFGFTDPKNAQDLARFVTEMTPSLIRQFNRVAGRERVKAAKELVTDPSSLEWQEMRRGFRINMSRSADDMERQMRISRQDFRRGLGRQRQDFGIMMDQQAEDYQTSMDRQEKAYKTTMDRAAEDMANMSNEILLSQEDVLEAAAKRLTGSAGKQARQVLQSFKDLKSDTTTESVAIMRELAAIFGFEYTVPASVGRYTKLDKAKSETPAGMTEPGIQRTNALGGVMPGYTPGRDIYNISVSGGEAIMRPEWTRAVGEKNIAALNHQARYGGFYAQGGVVWPVPGRDTGTYPGHTGVDINRGSGWDDLGDPIRAARGGRVAYAGWGQGYGNAIFIQLPGGLQNIYGHASKVLVRTGQNVATGQLIGEVGDTGNSSAPHLHFEVSPGRTYEAAMAFLRGAQMGGFAQTDLSDPGVRGQLRRVLKDRYPASEQSARQMTGVHPLFPGDISTIINRFARDKIRRLRRGRREEMETMTGGGIGRQPVENLNNEQIVRIAARRLGWGDQWHALHELIMHESGFRNTAQNPTSTAYGMFQFLDSTWGAYGGKKTSDPWLQTKYGMRYIKARYGDPQGAWNFWQNNNWYKDGSLFTSPNLIGVGEGGPEAVIPLNARGGEFMADVMAGVMGGRGMTPMRGGGNVYATKIDRSTTFTGPITVQANDPSELIRKLQARQRVMALSRPSLTGSAA